MYICINIFIYIYISISCFSIYLATRRESGLAPKNCCIHPKQSQTPLKSWKVALIPTPSNSPVVMLWQAPSKYLHQRTACCRARTPSNPSWQFVCNLAHHCFWYAPRGSSNPFVIPTNRILWSVESVSCLCPCFAPAYFALYFAWSTAHVFAQ